MLIIFLLLVSSHAVAMHNNDNDPFTPDKFDPWFQSVKQKEQRPAAPKLPVQTSSANATSPSSTAANTPARTIMPVMITRKTNNKATHTSATSRKKRKVTDDEDDDSSYRPSEENSSETPPPVPQTTRTIVIANPAAIMVAVPCIVLDCDWGLRFDPTLQGDAATRQRLRLANDLLHHCLRMHLSYGQLSGHIDWALTGTENPTV